MLASETEVKVRYAETDAMGVVHHSSYIVWMELGRTDFIEKLGMSYAQMEEQGFMLPVLEVNVVYKKPFRYGEKAWVETVMEHYDGLRITFQYHIFNEQRELCVKGQTSHAVVKKENFKPVSLKKHFPEMHQRFERVIRIDGSSASMVGDIGAR